jgi:hypothetical protein
VLRHLNHKHLARHGFRSQAQYRIRFGYDLERPLMCPALRRRDVRTVSPEEIQTHRGVSRSARRNGRPPDPAAPPRAQVAG